MCSINTHTHTIQHNNSQNKNGPFELIMMEFCNRNNEKKNSTESSIVIFIYFHSQFFVQYQIRSNQVVEYTVHSTVQ